MTLEETALLYHLLARSFAYPEPYFAEELAALVGDLGLEAWEGDTKEPSVLPIASFIWVLAALNQELPGTLQQEHERLFGIDGLKAALCPAHAWAYRFDLPRETLVETARNAYTTWGQEITPARATHVETQLEFMAYLCRRGDETASQTARRDFLYKHALAWLLRFAAAVTAATRLEFYQAASELLATFLKYEAATRYKFT
jgi:TorA maturation chaperone TorD